MCLELDTGANGNLWATPNIVLSRRRLEWGLEATGSREGILSLVKVLMMDVDGVLVHGRPEDRRHWSTSLEEDLGLDRNDLQREFFDMYWEDVVLGRVRLADSLSPVLDKIAPHLTADRLIAYWFERDSRLDRELLQELAAIRSTGILIYLATNQEHRRAQHLMSTLGLAGHVDGIHYSAQLGARKPSLGFFDRVASAMGFPAGELLLVDDSLDNTRAAEAAGWKAFHWTGEKSLTETLGETRKQEEPAPVRELPNGRE
jgi:putative hydrolase of the HAD superfamily